MSPLVHADCKIIQTSLHAAEGDPAYTARAVFEVLEITPEIVDVVLAGSLSVGSWAAPFRSGNSGATWGKTGTWTTNDTYTFQFFEAESGDVFAAIGGTVAAARGEIWKSTNRGQTWTRVARHGSERYFGCLCQADNGDLVAGTGPTTGEFWRSLDGGDTWAKVDQCAGGRYVACMVKALNGDLLAGVGKSGAQGEIYRSQDNGASWAFVQSFLPTTGGYVLSLARLANGTLLAGTSNTSAQIWQSADDGATWAKLSTLPTERLVYAIAQDADGVVYAASGDDCMAWRSADNGATWIGTELSTSGSMAYCLVVLSSGDVLIGTDIGPSGEAQVWRTRNHGISWSYYSQIEHLYASAVRSLLVLSQETTSWGEA